MGILKKVFLHLLFEGLHATLPSAMINAEVQKNDGENTVNLIRRFSKRVQGSGLIQRVRKDRYHSRSQSRIVRRKHTLQVIKRREEVKELIKLGKMLEQVPRKNIRR